MSHVPICCFCGLPIRPTDEHGVVSTTPAPDGGVTVTCHVTLTCTQPRKLGVITGTT